MNITFLSTDRPLTKTYVSSKSGLVKTPYPLTWEFTSHTESFTTLPQLEALLKKHAALGHCALKGKIARALVNESRRGSTNTNDATEWLVLDLDGLPETVASSPHPIEQPEQTKRARGRPPKNLEPALVGAPVPLTLDLFLETIGLGGISYIVQWSASYGIENKKIRAHIFMLLDKPYPARMLKEWLIAKNLETPLLADALQLASHGNALRWPLDISACQNDKLIYIAPPVLKGIKDPMAGKPRIHLVQKKNSVVHIPTTPPAKNEAGKKAHLARLRDEAGLPARKFALKTQGTTEYQTKIDEAMVTEMKTERGFVYFNLNGGNSWAYYHPENNPEFIYNFKGEATYLTKELLPDYWKQLTDAGIRNDTGVAYLAFCDRKTGAYWRGTYDEATNHLDLHQAKNETQVRHFCKQYGVPVGDFIPEWDLVFDPMSNVRVDPEAQSVNTFEPTEYMLGEGKPPKHMPPMTKKVIMHALGGDQACYDHFINWLATIVQMRDRTKTAWVLTGTEGTGKGLLLNKILRPLFGGHVAPIDMHTLSEPYNAYMRQALIVFVDEIQTSALMNEGSTLARMRNYIVEPTFSLRQMYSGATSMPNYSNWVLASNMPDPIKLKGDDRRYNIGKYQTAKLEITDAELEKLEKELQAVYLYLESFPADIALASTVIRSQDRDEMIETGRSSIDVVANATLAGDFGFFMDQLPTSDAYKRNALAMTQVTEYSAILKSLIDRTGADGRCHISREELHTLFNYGAGGGLPEKNKFTSMLRHYRIHMNKVWINGRAVAGITVTWKDTKSFPTHLLDLAAGTAPPPAPLKLVPKAPAKSTKKKATA